ncbi:ABC transporter permease [Nocardiopsis sp. HNM0947]|uniref:ABC transporter permease n=1 Tax=Nocardiopsis coralli TaxID=2772213 RepID=A0ABR9P9A7_9ACTN|nr:ABC transporter permease [Nocardiopsis coralli]MBE3000430.1 ABC transporter permease [Nocardiopsis coralli]
MSTHTENTAAAPVPRHRALRREIAAEWVRLSSLRSTWWCVAAAVAGMALFAGLMGWTQLSAARDDALASSDVEFAQLTSQGYFYLVQFSVLVLAALASTGEFAHRSAAATLAWNPDRSVVLLARALVTAALAAAASVVAGLTGTGVLAALLSGHVAFPLGEILATVFGAGLCMALFAALFVGVGTVLRGTAGTVMAGFLLLLGLPLVMQLSGVDLVDDLAALTPGLAGIEFYAAGDVGFYSAPFDGPVNVAVVVGWTVAALLAARCELALRDV